MCLQQKAEPNISFERISGAGKRKMCVGKMYGDDMIQTDNPTRGGCQFGSHHLHILFNIHVPCFQVPQILSKTDIWPSFLLKTHLVIDFGRLSWPVSPPRGSGREHRKRNTEYSHASSH